MEKMNQPQAPIQQPAESVIANAPIKPKKAFKKWLLIVLVIILVLSLPIGGYLLLGKMGIKSNASTVTIQTIKLTTTPNPTANWKTYSGNGFLINYPPDVLLQESDDPQAFITNLKSKLVTLKVDKHDPKNNNPNEDNFNLEIRVADNPNNLTPKQIIDKYLGPTSATHPETQAVNNKINSTMKDFKLNQISGTYAIFGFDYDYETIIMAKNNKIYTFIYHDGEGQGVSSKTNKTINQILSTFKFTDILNPTPTCRPRPACLDSTPRCLIAETEDMCPPKTHSTVIGCKVGGCSGELCLDSNSPNVASICIYKAEYACYKNAKCEKQTNGKCGWTKSQELTSCLDGAK
jgi:hypothetical protein